MIIDYNYPNRTADGWRVNVIKLLKDGRIYNQAMRFDNKDDAFEYYDHIHKMWEYQQLKNKVALYEKEFKTENHNR